jgi:rhamnogalacturonan lyase-like protein
MGTSAHELLAYDLNGDGKEEVIFGGTVLSPNGAALWKLEETIAGSNYGHVDTVVPGDLLPNGLLPNGSPKNEIYYTVEIPNHDSAAVMVDAMTGAEIWSEFGRHVHEGWAANVSDAHPGDECRAKDIGCSSSNPDSPCSRPSPPVLDELSAPPALR